MKHTMIHYALAAAAAAATMHAGAAVTVTFGAGTASAAYTNSATFEANTTLANNYVENGLLLSYSGAANNNGCGYGGLECYDVVSSELSPAFSGNYLGTAGDNAYVSIRLANGGDFQAIEFAAGSTYGIPLSTVNGYWQTWNNGTLTGSGSFARPAGVILGLADTAGFDEVRYFVFSAANKTSGFSSVAIDNVNVLAVPEPATWGMLAAGLGLLGLARRRRGASV